MITKYTNTTKPEINYEAPKQIIVKPHPENEEKKKNLENDHPENSKEKKAIDISDKNIPKSYEEEEKKASDQDINILCVKWGTRYNSEYVNKLYRGIKRNTTKKFIFHCFTEDPVGLMEGMNIIKLKEDWKGWWGKATLFSRGIIYYFSFNKFLVFQ